MKNITLPLLLASVAATAQWASAIHICNNAGPCYTKKVVIYNEIRCGDYYFTSFYCEHYLQNGECLDLQDGPESGGQCWHYYYVQSETLLSAASLSPISGPSLICPDIGANPAGAGCSTPSQFSVSVSPAQSGLDVDWTITWLGGSASQTVKTNGSGVSSISSTFGNVGSVTITAKLRCTGVNVSRVVQVTDMPQPTSAVPTMRWGDFIRTGQKPIALHQQTWTCTSQPLGLTELGFLSYAITGCSCSTNGAKRQVFAAMRFHVGNYWYGSDVIQYRNNPADVTAVINAEAQHYDSWEIYAITARQYWYDVKWNIYATNAEALAARNWCKQKMDEVGQLWLNWNAALDAVGGPHKSLGNQIKCGKCPQYCP